MHTSWKYLRIKDETALRDKTRLKKLGRASHFISLVLILAFTFSAVICFSLTAFFIGLGLRGEMPLLPSYGSALIMILLGISFVFAARLFWQERKLDLLRNCVLHPENFEFVEGTLNSFSYSPGSSRRNDRILVEGKALAKTGEELYALEQFSARIWPFTTVKADSQLRKDDDWYSHKGKRLTLPIKAYFIYDIKAPQVAALVGVSEDLIDRAFKVDKNSALS